MPLVEQPVTYPAEPFSPRKALRAFAAAAAIALLANPASVALVSKTFDSSAHSTPTATEELEAVGSNTYQAASWVIKHKDGTTTEVPPQFYLGTQTSLSTTDGPIEPVDYTHPLSPDAVRLLGLDPEHFQADEVEGLLYFASEEEKGLQISPVPGGSWLQVNGTFSAVDHHGALLTYKIYIPRALAERNSQTSPSAPGVPLGRNELTGAI